MRGPNGWRWRRFRHRLARPIWVVPAIYVVLALLASIVFAQWDESSPLDPPYGLSSSSASTALAALGSGMLAFTGFVTAVVLLIIQFGSTQFSQRCPLPGRDPGLRGRPVPDRAAATGLARRPRR